MPASGGVHVKVRRGHGPQPRLQDRNPWRGRMTDRTDAADVAANYVRTITAEVEGAPEPWDAAAEYTAEALDADYVVTSRGDVKAVHLVVGTGGPHVEVHHRIGAEVVQVRVWWWGDYAEASVHAPALAADLDGLGDAWQENYAHVGVGR